MPNQKLEAELNLSLSLSEEERFKNPILSSGYEPSTDRWRLILLYNGSLDEIKENLSIHIVPLIGNFAIIEIPTEQIPTLLTYPQILYLELSRPLYQDAITGISASCFSGGPYFPQDESNSGLSKDEIPSASSNSNLSNQYSTLTGRGVAIAILDSGVDFRHPDFQTASGQSRILTYWDQTLSYDGANVYGFGYIFSNEELNTLLTSSGPLQPSADFTGHGTHIAGICAGNGRASNGKNRGAAPEASLIVVKLKNEASSIYTDYANLMMAIDYSIHFARKAALPLSMNISYGSNDGSHDGNSLIELFIRNCIFYGKTTVTIATGNEGISKRHSSIQVNTGQTYSVGFSVAPGETSLYLQLWKYDSDTFSYELVSPGQNNPMPIPGIPGIMRYILGENEIHLIISEPTPYQPLQELFIAISPVRGSSLISAGIWQLNITSSDSANGRVNLWLPSREATNTATGFLEPSTDMTFTVPSTASNVISVSGYDSTTDVFASFSGRGFSNSIRTKPDLTAPAVNILSTAPGGGYSIRTGTSMAAPFVTGAAALLMEYGIANGNDPFLYGEKVRAKLWKGARPLPAFREYPNASVGWGALCFKDSL